MKSMKIAASILIALFGVFLFFFGGYDDSPGAQLLGVIVFIGGIVGLVKTLRKN